VEVGSVSDSELAVPVLAAMKRVRPVWLSSSTWSSNWSSSSDSENQKIWDLAHNSWSNSVGRAGLEPTTPCVSCKCATNCANGP
jgi:hypothetical protein